MRKIKLISSISSDHNGRKQTKKNQLREENWKFNKYVEVTQHATEQLMGQWKKSKEKFKNTLRQMKMEIQHSKIWDSSNAVLRKKLIINKCLLQEKRKISNK